MHKCPDCSTTLVGVIVKSSGAWIWYCQNCGYTRDVLTRELAPVGYARN